MELVIKLSTTYQTYYILNDSGLNIEKTHEFYTHYNLFLIFKELYPDYFEENTGPGRPRTYTASIIGLLKISLVCYDFLVSFDDIFFHPFYVV